MPHKLLCNWPNKIDKALLDLGTNVNMLLYTIYKQFGVGELKPKLVTL